MVNSDATEAQRIGAAVKTRRRALGLTQAALAEAAGLPAAQSVSEIEKGERELKAIELVRVARALHTELNTLLAIEEPEAEPRVLWRRGSRGEHRAREAQLLERSRRYAQLERWCNEEARRSLPDFDFDPPTASWHDVEHLAEDVRRELDLGAVPARTLVRALEQDFGVKIFYERLTDDADGDCSAACVRDPQFGSAILMDVSEAPWRRMFSFAHELFHLITWTATEKAWTSSGAGVGDEPSWYAHLEKLAEHFASNLLMPAEPLLARFDGKVRSRRILSNLDFAQLAIEFGVSTQALVIRLASLGRISKSKKEELRADSSLNRLARALRPVDPQRGPPFPERYESLARAAYLRREIGKSMVAKYLERNVADLADLHLPTPDVSQTTITAS